MVTGGGSGIGRGLAVELAKRGANVAIGDIIAENGQEAAEEINAAGGRAVAFHCDVCDRTSINRFREETNAALGPVNLVFANAGATSFDPLMDMSDDDVDWIVQVNLMGVMNTTRAFLPQMMEAKEGHIIATASMAGLLPAWVPVHTVYSAAKMGIIGLMMNLALEMKEYNVHTTIYCPGGVATAMKERNAMYRPERFGGPGAGEVHLPDASFKDNPLKFYGPDAVAPMVLNAVLNNRPFVFDHPEQRQAFRDTYSSVVEACYDDIEEYEKQHGKPAALEH